MGQWRTDDRRCYVCKEIKPLEAFRIKRNKSKGRDYICCACDTRLRAEHKKKTYHRKYGMTLKEYQELAKKQNDACAICLSQEKLVVDHDHKTGAMRGLLCGKCNTGLGMLKDDPEIIMRAAEYIKKAG